MALIRATVVFQGFTNAVTDRYVNTFHFSHVDNYTIHRAAVQTALENFYIANATGGSAGVGLCLAPCVNRVASINTYNLADIEPRIPTTTTFTLPTAESTGNLPQEVACCLSYRGALPIHPRRRGRIYIGPLHAGTQNTNFGSSTVYARVGDTIIQRLREHAKDLRNNGNVGWCVLSNVPSQNVVPIVAGHVDQAFDTQRRRGHETTVRLLWDGATP